MSNLTWIGNKYDWTDIWYEQLLFLIEFSSEEMTSQLSRRWYPTCDIFGTYSVTFAFIEPHQVTRYRSFLTPPLRNEEVLRIHISTQPSSVYTQFFWSAYYNAVHRQFPIMTQHDFIFGIST